jgi:hypothetical protein
MKRKHLTETPVCPRERLVIISYTTGLSFAPERIGTLATIIITVFYLLVLYLFVLPNTPEYMFASIYSESLIKTACQHLLLLVGFDTLIYRKYYDTPPILVGHHSAAAPGGWWEEEEVRGACVARGRRSRGCWSARAHPRLIYSARVWHHRFFSHADLALLLLFPRRFGDTVGGARDYWCVPDLAVAHHPRMCDGFRYTRSTGRMHVPRLNGDHHWCRG